MTAHCRAESAALRGGAVNRIIAAWNQRYEKKKFEPFHHLLKIRSLFPWGHGGVKRGAVKIARNSGLLNALLMDCLRNPHGIFVFAWIW
jgi:hypothetical protein